MSSDLPHNLYSSVREGGVQVSLETRMGTEEKAFMINLILHWKSI